MRVFIVLWASYAAFLKYRPLTRQSQWVIVLISGANYFVDPFEVSPHNDFSILGALNSP